MQSSTSVETNFTVAFEHPFVSVVMPVRNEAGFISRSLSAVLAQTYPATRYEVLVADGMSTDITRLEIKRLAAAHPDIPITIVDNPRGIVPTGLNAAIQQARGDIIIRVDGHTVIDPDYIERCVDLLKDTDADNVGGPMVAVSQSLLGRAVALATSSPFGVGGARFHYSNAEEWVDTVYMGAWRKQIFERIGFFDEAMVRNQDDEFNYRLRSAGGKILLSPRVRSQYYNRSSLTNLWKQYFQYGYWKVRVLQKHPLQMQMRQFVPPLFVVALGSSALLALVSRLGRVLLLLVAGSYAVANTGASVQLASRNGWKYLVHLPAVFAVLHMSYGLGFLLGLFRFRNTWHKRTL